MSDPRYMKNVLYLEAMDINADGSLKSYVTNGKPAIVMVQGNFCGFCTKAKPDFEKFVGATRQGFTLQTDGSPEEQAARPLISSWGANQGVPAYVLFSGDGKVVSTVAGAKDAQSLMKMLRA